MVLYATRLLSVCPVIWYADDMLLLVRAELKDIKELKRILDDFAGATGSCINFNKSTVVPMHVSRLKRPYPPNALDSPMLGRHISTNLGPLAVADLSSS